MKLLFKQLCSCKGMANLPKPSVHITSSTDMSVEAGEIKLIIDLTCPLCGASWEGYAGFKYEPKSTNKLIH